MMMMIVMMITRVMILTVDAYYIRCDDDKMHHDHLTQYSD